MKKQKLFQQILMKRNQNFYILHEFLLITIALLIVVSIYCYFIKHRAKQKHILPFHDTYNKLRVYINEYIIKTESNDKLKEIDIKIARGIISMI